MLGHQSSMLTIINYYFLFFIAATAVLEEQLTSLGERWASVCQWTEQQWSVLQDVQLQWQRYADAQRQFEDWLSKAESSLAIMRLTQPHSDTDAMEMLKKIKVCAFSAIY